MRIADSNIQLYTQHTAVERNQRNEQLTYWVDDKEPTHIEASQSDTHVHALGTPGWAEALVDNAIKFKKSRQ